MNLRQDLIELNIEALTALANAGFVKRAQKDLAEGRLPQIEYADDGCVRARYEDGHCASLAAAKSLREALCTCPATGLCRHRVTLVLAYQQWVRAQQPALDDSAGPVAESGAETAWSPGEFDDAALAAALAPSVLEQATRLAAARPVIRLQAWHPQATAPIAHLPLCNVRFFSRRNLSHARCDCRLGGSCEHVALAVWAFRQAGGLADATVALTPRHAAAVRSTAFGPAEQDIESAVARLLRRLWLDGSSQDLAPLDAEFAGLRECLSALGWRWLLECLDELYNLLLDQAGRSSRFDPQRLVAVMAELQARLSAARSAAQQAAPLIPASQILGLGVRGEVALEHLKLVSLGLQCWSDEHQDGARVLFADPDTLAVTVLERSWVRGDGDTPTPILNRRVAGQSLRQLACAQVVTRGAKRRANGLIDIAALARQTQVLPLSAQSWEGLAAPLRQPGGAALASHLGQASPDFVRPRQAVVQVHVLPVAAVEHWGWDAATQTLYARLLCCEDAEKAQPGDSVQLGMPHVPAAVSAVDALALVLSDVADPPQRIAGLASLREGRVWLTPLAVLTRERAVVLQAGAAAVQRLDLQPLQLVSAGLAALLDRIFEEIVVWARQGLRHQPATALQRAQGLADELASHGLERSAELMQQILAEWRGATSAALSYQLTTLVLLLQGLLHGAVEEGAAPPVASLIPVEDAGNI